MSIDNLPPLREVIERHDLMPKKSLGQNFLFDLNLTSKIARQAGNLQDQPVIEVGPGPGGLTRALLAQGAIVTAIERDERCLDALAEIEAHYPGRLRIISGDALEQDFKALFPDGPKPQREVGERIVAAPDTDHYGRLGVLAGWRTHSKIAFDVPPQAFTPPPKVMSSVVHITPREEPLPCRADALGQITQAAFGQRRKMLRQSLKPVGGAQLLEKTGIDGTRRAETLSVEEFVALANAYRPV
jgi:16S rRNA (adenine1518-N6/adenine1519-N6)-dimethyltransferase